LFESFEIPRTIWFFHFEFLEDPKLVVLWKIKEPHDTAQDQGKVLSFSKTPRKDREKGPGVPKTPCYCSTGAGRSTCLWNNYLTLKIPFRKIEYFRIFNNILHFHYKKTDYPLRKVKFENLSISKYNIICAEAAKVLRQGTNSNFVRKTLFSQCFRERKKWRN